MNRLQFEPSLYLQQHKNNPVDWYPWGEEAWKKAKSENKLVLISIGYSSCHWCHVMEHESFEDEATAAIMNKYFVCIKVDREERPDIDQIYMTAVQLMTGSGGWPLNCFALPDGKPVYGGTYFPNVTWKDLLMKLENFYRNSPDQAHQYAEELTGGISMTNRIELKTSGPEKNLLPAILDNWKRMLDNIHGGPNRAPKFPLPNNYEFLLRYAISNQDQSVLDHVKLTLNKMAFGGIYDQIGGGFARYSTDTLWKVPHFEKMLYDNAQLIGLYAKAYKYFKDPLYKEIVHETDDFLFHEMSDLDGSYYSALDADSEGVEGKYYVWTEKELNAIDLPEMSGKNGREILYDYFNINRNGYWEHDNYILLRKETDQTIADKYGISTDELRTFIIVCKQRLLTARDKRVSPGLDKKVIVSWNALLISGLCEAYEAFNDEIFLERARQIADAILKNAVNENGTLLHLSGRPDANKSGFLEDYAFMITGLIRLYQCTLEESYLTQAKKFADDAFLYFHDAANGFFFFNSSLDEPLITRKKEIHDNVIPASNSELARGLFYLSRYYNEDQFEKTATEMMSSVTEELVRYGSSYSNWGLLYMDMTEDFSELVIEGPEAMEYRKHFLGQYHSGLLFAGGVHPSDIPLRKDRYVNGKTLLYLCRNKTCNLPVSSIDAISLK